MFLPIEVLVLRKSKKMKKTKSKKNKTLITPTRFLTVLFSLFPLLGLSQQTLKKSKFLPENILIQDSKISHHVIVVDKSTHELHIYENDLGIPKRVKTFRIATGEFKGDKRVQGDKRTPEGIYTFQEFIPRQELLDRYGKEGEIYGIGAFTMDYPNYFDIRDGKTGGGIWLHSTNDNSRILRGLDSRGCIVSVDEELTEISQYIQLEKTPIIVQQEMKFMEKSAWLKLRADIQELVNNWQQAWQSKDFQSYIKFYHPKRYSDSFRKNFRQFSDYKRAVFSKPGDYTIRIDNISVLRHKNNIRIQFLQDYKSNTIEDIGLKTLYVTLTDTYEWKIIHEKWQKIDDSTLTAFTPSQRFFSEKDMVLN